MDMDTQHTLETKAGIAPEALVTHGDLLRAFEAFKEANDERVSERRGGDVVIEEKVARINDTIEAHQRRLDEITLKQARPPLDRDNRAAMTHDRREHKSAFDGYMRTGESVGLRALEVKAMSVGSNPDGGYVVPVEIEKAIGERLTAISPIRSIAGVREISGNVYKKPFMTAGPAVGWVGETDARPQTTSPTLDSALVPGDGALCHAGGDGDAARRRRRQYRRVARRRGRAGVRGAGGRCLRHRRRIEQAEGLPLLHQHRRMRRGCGATSATSRPASAGAFPTSDPSDVLVDLIYALKAGYRQNGTFVMNRKTQAVDAQVQGRGRQLSLAAAGAGRRQGATLMSFPIVEAEDMPDIAANSYSVAFGDFRRGYLIVDRQGVRVLRDPYHRQALRAVLHHQARRRRRAGLRRNQAAEVCGELIAKRRREGRRQRCAPAIPIKDRTIRSVRHCMARAGDACVRAALTLPVGRIIRMAQFHPAWLAERRRYYTRPDGHRWLRPNAELYRKPKPSEPKDRRDMQTGGLDIASLDLAHERKELLRLGRAPRRQVRRDSGGSCAISRLTAPTSRACPPAIPMAGNGRGLPARVLALLRRAVIILFREVSSISYRFRTRPGEYLMKPRQHR